MFDWSEYLRLSHELGHLPDDEAAQRAAISRAYYACFGMARWYATAQGAVLAKNGTDHVLLWDWFEQSQQKTAVAVAQAGKRLKIWRRLADYEDQYMHVTRHVPMALATADQLLSDLARLP